jgi:hypothetical protein
MVYLNGTHINLKKVEAGSAEFHPGRKAKGFDIDLYRRAGRIARGGCSANMVVGR